MTKKYTSMLRGINVGGKVVQMEKLRAIYDSLGFKQIWTYIQSGNVMFSGSTTTANATPYELESKIEKKLANVLGFEVRVLVRTESQIMSVIKKNPFTSKDKEKLYVTFLKEQATNDFPSDEIRKVVVGEEDFHPSYREIYLFCPYGYGRTKLSNTFFERKLKTVATTRNWNTVNAFVTRPA